MKKTFKQFRKCRDMNEVIEPEDKGEYDYEGDMVKSSLKTIIRNAQIMYDMLEAETNLPEWVQGKVTLAEDYIVSAAQYMQSEMKEEVEQVDEISKELAWKAANKSLEKTRVAAYHSIYGGESGHKKFLKAVRQGKKISDYASAKTPKVPYVKEEQVTLDQTDEAVEIKPQANLAAAIAAYKKKPTHSPKQYAKVMPAVKKSETQNTNNRSSN